jgi:selenocysteine lyase
MIVGLGKAAELVIKNLEKYSSHLREIRDYLEKRLEVVILFYILLK